MDRTYMFAAEINVLLLTKAPLLTEGTTELQEHLSLSVFLNI